MSALSNRPGRLGVGIVGAGRVGAVLGAALHGAGHTVVGVSAVSDESKERAELLLPGAPILTVPEVVQRAELVLLAVPDDQLEDLVAGLARTQHWQAGQLVVHVAGRWGVGVLEPARAAGAIPLAIHPAMTFTGMSMDVARLAECPFGVTAPAAVLPIAQALVVEMGGEPLVVPEADRGLYHAALTHGANHVSTLVGQSLEILGGAGIENPAQVLGPLARASVDNALRTGESALTGPVVRGDAGTLREHRQALEEAIEHCVSGDVLPTYIGIASATAQRAHRRGVLHKADYEQVTAALTGTSAHRASDLLVVKDPADFRAVIRERVQAVGPQATIGFVPTMGALHDGHEHLVHKARQENDLVVVSIFVNPLQFGPHEDFARYPADLEGDVSRLRAAGVDVVFAPSVESMYPGGDPLVRVSSGELGTQWEGASRPGHFDGVLTVVAKLFSLVGVGCPVRAYFGQKDAQQLLLVRRMVRDLNMDIDVRSVPIVRAEDGVALSSRNAYLNAQERIAARVLSRSLTALAEKTANLEQVREQINSEVIGQGPQAVRLDYLTVVDPDTLSPVDPAPGALALVAAWVGNTRLIDNRIL